MPVERAVRTVRVLTKSWSWHGMEIPNPITDQKKRAKLEIASFMQNE